MILENVRPRNSRFWLRSCIEFLESFRQFVSSFSFYFFLFLSHSSLFSFSLLSIRESSFHRGAPERCTGSCFESCCAFGQTGQGLFFPLGEKVYRGVVFLFAFEGRMESLIGLERIKDWIIENFVNKMIRVMNICGTFGEKFFFDLRNFDNETNARILFFFFLLKFLWKNFCCSFVRRREYWWTSEIGFLFSFAKLV